MTIRVLIRRRLREEAGRAVSDMLIKARTNAMDREGYISSETLSGCDDPKEVLVISTWRNKADWDAYAADPNRIGLEGEFEPLQEGPAEYLAYKLGIR